MDKLRMGVLGCSRHYELRVALPLRSSLLVEPYAVASRNGAKAQAFADKLDFPKAYGSYEALLADPDVDFVYIPLPNHLHLEYIKKAAEAGKPVLCEKPVCLNAKEAAEAAAYCQSRNVPLMEAFMYRFHPQWVRAKEIVTSGEIGELLTVHAHFSYSNKDGTNIRNRAETGGGAVYDIGCYTVSSARHLFGREPARVICTLVRDASFKTDILVSALLDFGEGRAATFTIGTQMHPSQRVDAIGSGGSLSIEVPFNMYPDVPGKVTVFTGVGQRLIETEIADQYLLEFDAYAESIIQQREAPTPVSDAIANMAVLDALFKSAASGAWETVRKY
ncbi:MAG: Gfo/Idh/MocA family oxidoreductase [Treponema sp.]|jgi:predicted dehydrogenase|nr:Gfo/Idh/MocA family oxidoreductase [Treponema sp.]